MRDLHLIRIMALLPPPPSRDQGDVSDVWCRHLAHSKRTPPRIGQTCVEWHLAQAGLPPYRAWSRYARHSSSFLKRASNSGAVFGN